MQYTDHYNFNLPEGTDIVNPLVQDNPNYTAIDSALYANKLRVVGTATELTTGTVHALTRADQDIAAFKFVATSDYASGDTFTVDGVSVTARLANGKAMPDGAYKINSTLLCILDGTVLNFVNIDSLTDADHCLMPDSTPVSTTIEAMKYNNTADGIDISNYTSGNYYTVPADGYLVASTGTDGELNTRLRGATSNYNIDDYVTAGQNHAIYVRKGMRVTIPLATGSHRLKFFELTA